MARFILVASALVFGLAGAGAIVTAVYAAPELERLLPPLVIDTDALRGTLITLGVGFGVLGLVHVFVRVALAMRWRIASVAGVLLGAVLAATSLALAAASATSAVARPEDALAFILGAVGASVGVGWYAALTVALLREMRSGSAS